MSQQESGGRGGAEEVARRAAARLAGEVDPGLPAQTERAIAGGAAEGMRSYDPALALGLAGFLLSVAQFGWTIYRDFKEDREKAAEKADRERAAIRDKRRTNHRAGLGALLARRIRLGMETPPDVTPERRDRIVEVVVEEILRDDAAPGAAGAGGWDREALR